MENKNIYLIVSFILMVIIINYWYKTFDILKNSKKIFLIFISCVGIYLSINSIKRYATAAKSGIDNLFLK